MCPNGTFFSSIYNRNASVRSNRSISPSSGNAWSDQETKTLLSDTAQLHRKLSEMSQRIRQLEDALEISHSSNSSSSSQMHPLLREELLAIKRGIDVNTPSINGHKQDREDSQTEDELEALGTLSISDQGYSRFIGSGGSEVCHQVHPALPICTEKNLLEPDFGEPLVNDPCNSASHQSSIPPA